MEVGDSGATERCLDIISFSPNPLDSWILTIYRIVIVPLIPPAVYEDGYFREVVIIIDYVSEQPTHQRKTIDSAREYKLTSSRPWPPGLCFAVP